MTIKNWFEEFPAIVAKSGATGATRNHDANENSMLAKSDLLHLLHLKTNKIWICASPTRSAPRYWNTMPAFGVTCLSGRPASRSMATIRYMRPGRHSRMVGSEAASSKEV